MSKPRVSGLNHITLAVTDLDRSVGFYRDLLGFDLRKKWPEGAYLEAGALWLCLTLEVLASSAPRADYTHIAFDVAEDALDFLSERIREVAEIWQENTSEGPSLYFLDPDGHKLELHVGSLASRLSYDAQKPGTK